MTQLPGVVQAAPDQAKGFDTDSVVTATVAAQFFQQGYQFCLRYLSLGAGQADGDLSVGEAQNILAAGLALMPVQHVPMGPWLPDGALGSEYGQNAATNASSLGLPPGLNVWLDLEAVSTSAAAQDVIDHCKNWYYEVSSAGYVPGLYVGANCCLNGQELYDLPFQHYWQSASEVPQLAGRGYQMRQAKWETINGISIDPDTITADEEGGTPLWLINPPA